jgi:RNA polymerase sigma-70 factor (ECF subfamily)
MRVFLLTLLGFGELNSMKPSNHINDEAEFVALLTASQKAIVLAVRALMPGERCVDEVVQQTNAKLWQKRSEFGPGTNFRAWANAIARFEVLNYRKQQARDARIKFSDELERIIVTETAAIDDEMLSRQSALRECLKQFKSDSREILLSRYSGDETLTQLAARVGRSVGGIKVTLSRLRTALLECIERRLLAEEQ